MVGVDEVGRGCVAGPLLVVAARAKGELPNGLKDSKLLTRLQREHIYIELVSACDWGQGWVKPAEINKLGLAKSLKLAVKRALDELGADLDEEVLMDGIVNYVPAKYKASRCEAKADQNYPIVSAASILAKVTRDNFMQELATRHPHYGFEKHVGYGTKEHYRLLQKYGPLKHTHRTIFAPFKQIQAEASV